MKTKTSAWLLAISMFISFGVNAQNLVVTLKNASTVSFAISGIQSIKFGSESMIVNELNGTINTWDIKDIDNYAFDNPSSVNTTSNLIADELNVYPNPASSQVHINYTSNRSGAININVYDINGRLMERLFNGEHREKTEITWSAKQNSSIQTGKYFIKISSENSAITKPIIIQ